MATFTPENSRSAPDQSRSASASTSQHRIEIVVGVAVVLAVVTLIVGAIAFIYDSVTKFATPDDTQSSVTSTKTQTVYVNSKYDLTLTLPGRWQQVGDSQFKDFCNLSNDVLSARLRPIFPMVYVSADRYAEILRKVYLERGWALASDSPMEIHGRNGHTLLFHKNISGEDRNLQLTIVKKWPVIYLLTISGPRESNDWSGITEALPQSIDVK